MKRAIKGLILTVLFAMLFGLSAFAATSTSKQAVVGDSFYLQVTKATGTVRWVNSNSSVVNIAKTSNANKVQVTAKGVGTAKVSVYVNGKLSSTCTVKVYKPNFGLSGNISLVKGKSKTIKINSGFGIIKVGTSNKKVATVSKVSSGKYKITAKKKGTAIITISYSGRIVKYKVTVTNKEATKLKIAVAYGEKTSVQGTISILKKYGGVDVEMVNSNVDVSKYAGLVIPTDTRDINPARYGEKNTGKSKGINNTIDSQQIIILSKFSASNKPILGLGNGMQIINVYFGGKLNQDIQKHKLSNTKVITVGGSRIQKLFGNTFTVTCNHHQSIGKLGSSLLITAISTDGRVEAIEHKTKKIWGIQWNTERTLGCEEILIRDFVTACR